MSSLEFLTYIVVIRYLTCVPKVKINIFAIRNGEVFNKRNLKDPTVSFLSMKEKKKKGKGGRPSILYLDSTVTLS